MEDEEKIVTEEVTATENAETEAAVENTETAETVENVETMEAAESEKDIETMEAAEEEVLEEEEEATGEESEETDPEAESDEEAAEEAELDGEAAEAAKTCQEPVTDDGDIDAIDGDGTVAKVRRSKTTIAALAFVLVCIIIAAVLIVVGINKKNKAAEAEKAAQEAAQAAQTGEGPVIIPDSTTAVKYDIVANVEVEGIKVGLAQYRDVVITAKKGVVSEDQFNEAIDTLAASFVTYNEVTDRECKEGDLVSIDYAGSIDGVAFDGGTGSTDQLVLGSGSMIPGFEDGIIGHRTGEEFDIDVTFPENYGKEELNGKPAVFHITLKMISESASAELSDELVAENTDYKTVDEFKAFVRDYLQNAADTNEINSAKSQFWQDLIASCTFEGDLTELNERYEEELTNYTLQTQGDTPMNIMMNYYGYDEAAARAYVDDQVLKTTKQELILKAVIANEGMTLDEEEYEEYITMYMSYVQATSREEFFELIGGDEDFFKEDYMQNKAYDFVDECVTVNVE